MTAPLLTPDEQNLFCVALRRAQGRTDEPQVGRAQVEALRARLGAIVREGRADGIINYRMALARLDGALVSVGLWATP